MSIPHFESGLASVNGAQLYYEIAGQGQPFVMIHAGVADNRQWNNEFAHFAANYRVVRFDLRGYGKSEPAEGSFSHLENLVGLLDWLKIEQPAILMGCSMGGGMAMDFALSQPARAKALIMVGSAPGGLELDVPTPAKFAEAEKAYEARDWDLLAELETQIWFDGTDRTPDQVNPAMRQLAYDMNRTALTHEAKGLGKVLPNLQPPAAERVSELTLPILVIVGDRDTPYILAAADYMAEKLKSARKMVIENAAHLPNLDEPALFQGIVETFLKDLL